MIEKYIQQYCKKNKYSRIKYIQLLNNCHVLSMFMKLVVICILSFYFVNSAINWVDTEMFTYDIGNNSVVQIDTASTRDSVILIITMVITFTLMSIIDIIDLLLWWERTNRDLVISVLGNIFISAFIMSININISLIKILGVSILEPSIYVFIFLVLYKKFQYKNKIYHKIKGEHIK